MAADLDKWKELAAKELRGKDLDTLHWESPDGIKIKPLYTRADLEGLEEVDTTPGMFPFVRGPRATMYANRPWTFAPVRGLLDRRGSRTRSTSRNLARAANRASPSRSISRRTEATTPTTSG